MRRVKWRSLGCLIFLLCLLMNLPEKLSQKTRLFAIGSIAPTWEVCQMLKGKIGQLLAISSPYHISESSFLEMETLKRENRLLSLQVENLRKWLVNEDRIEEQILRLKAIDSAEVAEKWRPFFARRRDQMARILKLQIKSLPARVIYREPCSWSSFLWIDLGESENRRLQDLVIGKNSPVVIGNILVGVVEEVGEYRSKVRLITDSRLVPSVRAVRGDMQNRILVEQIERLLQSLQSRPELFSSDKEAASLFSSLQKLSIFEESSGSSLYLAKGELFGSSFPLWRSRGQSLKGVGFNYDFSDEEGEAKDLRAVDPVLIKEGDLLVTSGLDGIFPPGLEVAMVRSIACLREGGYFYEIEAKSLVENLDELSSVFVLPPLSL